MPTPSPSIARTAAAAAIAVLAIVAVIPLLTSWRPVGQASAAPTASDATGPTKGITVEGVGRVTVSPDLAAITAGVQADGSTAAAAQSRASAAMAKIIAAEKALGVVDKDLATQWVALQPQYQYSQSGSTPPKVIGYQASQTLSIKVRHLEKAGGVIDAAVGAGANQIGGISFSVSDATAASAQARTAAVTDARARAQALASAASVTLGSAIAISEVTSPAPTPIPYADTSKAAGVSAPTPIQPGTTDVEVVVQITFATGG
ncbi:MAG TPA: SIMPL domain-containing protein [Candidatus Limnocylindrales bacterium]|jgi:uncharacterized protein YggE